MIRSATEAYNRAARALNPPRPSLDWSQVSHYTFLDEFNLLRNTRHDISTAPWANPVVREAIKKFLCVCRAREEINRCNIEVRRLFTLIYNENARFDTIITELDFNSNIILGATKEHCLRRHRVNSLLLEWIESVFSLDGFTGSKTLGFRKGCHPQRADIGMLTSCDHTVDDDEDFDIDEADTSELDGLVNFVTSF